MLSIEELSEIWNLAEKQGKEKEAQEKLWDYKGISKSKRFYFKHTKHMEIIFAISIPILGIMALLLDVAGDKL